MVLQERPAKTPTDRTEEPDLGTGLIDPSRYTSPEFAQLEWDRMWTKTWLNAGPLADIPEVGDYFTHELGRESFIFMRTGSGEKDVKGFYNICPHRGSRLRTGVGCGHADQLQCPFHLWNFNIEGKLQHVPDEQHFVNGIPDDKRRLSELKVDSWGGFIWYSLDPEAEPLLDFLGVIPAHLAPYHLGTFHLMVDYVIEWECNWKFAVDEFAEIYHIPGLHPQLLENWDHLGTPLDIYDGGRHSRQLIRVGYPDGSWDDDVARRFGYPNAREITDSQRQSLATVGVDPDGFEGDAGDVREVLLARRRGFSETMGLDVSDLLDEQLLDDYHYMIFPNITLNMTGTGCLFFRPRPHPSNPNKCFWDYQVYGRVPEGADPPPRPQTIVTKASEVELFEALHQDMSQAQIVQQSYHSQGYTGILLNSEERRIRAMHKAIDDYIAGPDR